MKFVPCNRNQIILHTLTNNQNDSCTSWLVNMHNIKTNNQKLIWKNHNQLHHVKIDLVILYDFLDKWEYVTIWFLIYQFFNQINYNVFSYNVFFNWLSCLLFCCLIFLWILGIMNELLTTNIVKGSKGPKVKILFKVLHLTHGIPMLIYFLCIYIF
jgi:hypothetical protein